MKSLNRMVDIILMIAVFFLYPLLFFGLKQDSLTRTAVDMSTDSLVEYVKSNGYLDKDRYEAYLDQLSKTGLTYHLSFEHRLKVHEPEYRFRTPEEIIEGQDSAYTGSNNYHYRPVTTEIPTVIDPVYTGNLNTETNESVLASAVNTGSSPTHVHTDACYRHIEEPKYTHYHAHTGNCRKGNAAIMPSGTCTNCNEVIQYGFMWYFFDSYYNEVFSSAHWLTSCPKCGASGPSIRNSFTQYDVMYSCGYRKDLNGDGWCDVVPVGVTESYPNRPLPQGYSQGTIISGPWSYHTHISSYAGVFSNGYWNSANHISLSDYARAESEGRTYRDSNGYIQAQPYTYTTIHGWASEIINRYGREVCSFPSYLSIGWTRTLLLGYVVEPYNYIGYNEFTSSLNVQLSPRKLNGTVVYDYSVNLGVSNVYNKLFPAGLTTSDLTVKSSHGKFSKNYFTIDDLANFGNIPDIYEYFYSLLIDKTSKSAKLFELYRTPYTSIYREYDDYGYRDIYVFDYRQPIVGRVTELNLPSYNDYTASANGSRGRLFASGSIDTCTYTDGQLYRWNLDPSLGNGLICNQIVNSITPTHPTQTVYQNDPLITTVIATYADGSTKTVVATTNFSTANLCQNQTATLTYTYTIEGTSDSKTCTIIVTVVPRNKTCGNGHIYNLNSDGSDPGCPYCKAWLLSLTLITPADGKLTIYRGTTLESNGVEVKAVYLNGREEIVTEGYVDNLDDDYIGTQTVTIGYKGKVVSLVVTVKRNLTRCTVCTRFYELYPDDSDPGCPYCAARTPIFTGNVLSYKKEEYTDDILKELYDGDGIYYFSRGDFFKVILTNSSRSLGGKMTAAVYKNMADETIRIEHSGIVREDGQ